MVIFRTDLGQFSLQAIEIRREQLDGRDVENQSAVLEFERAQDPGIGLRRGPGELEASGQAEEDVGSLEEELVETLPALRFQEVADPVVDHNLAADQFGAAGQLARLDEVGPDGERCQRNQDRGDHGPGSSSGSNVGQSIFESALVWVMKTPLSGSSLTTHSLEGRSNSIEA